MTKEERIDISEYGYDENKGIWSKHWEKFLTGNINKKGYVYVGLKCIDGKKRLFGYHRALWYLAYGPIPEGYEINHISEVKTDNRLCNLELVTHKQNINYGTRNQRAASKHRGVPKPHLIEQNKRLKSKEVVAIDKDGNVVYEFASTNEVERQMNYSHSHISKCCRNCYMREGNRFFKGYYWYYKEDWEKLVWEKEQKRLHFKLT